MLYGIWNALIDNQTNNITTIADLFDILNFSTLPKYWFWCFN